nr:ORF1 [Raccoon dog Torque teno virus 2]
MAYAYKRRYWRRPYGRRTYRSFRRGWRPRNARRGRRWRRTFRRRRRRVRRYRKRTYPSRITHWNPKHRTICFINGWAEMLAGNPNSSSEKSSVVIYKKGVQDYEYLIKTGGTNIIEFGIDWFWWENRFGRNYWTRDYMGFDLARYFGLKLKFYPHSLFDYVVWWDREYDGVNLLDYSIIQPGNLLTQPHHFIVRSRISGNRRGRKLFLAPPSLLTSAWFQIKAWCGVSLGRVGVSWINLPKPIMHQKSTTIEFYIGFDTKISNQGNYTQLNGNWSTGSSYSVQANATINTGVANYFKCFYRWDWDDGKGNALILGMPGDGNSKFNIYHYDMPYWKWFWGKEISDFYIFKSMEGTTYQSPVAFIWWYIYQPGDGTHDPFQNKKGLQGLQKAWIQVVMPQSGSTTLQLMTGGPPKLQAIAKLGPFAMAESDFGDGTANMSLTFKYSAKWQWGGTTDVEKTIQNPCSSAQQQRLQINRPEEVGDLVIHPWDMANDGAISDLKMSQLIRKKKDRRPPPNAEDLEDLSELDFFDTSDTGESSDWDSESDEELDNRRLRKKLKLLKKQVDLNKTRHKMLTGGLKGILKK